MRSRLNEGAQGGPYPDIEQADVAEILQNLVSIPSHDSEVEMVDYLSRSCESLGVPYSVRALHRGHNISATWGEGERSLILNSHMDTVPPGDPDGWHYPVGTVAERRLYGRGAADAKGSLAAMLAVMKALVKTRTPLKGKLTLMAVGQEERDGLGTSEEMRAGVRAEAAIVGEPTELVVCRAHKGVLKYRVTVRGRASHASRPEEGINAIAGMGKVIQALERLCRVTAKKRDTLLGSPTLAITLIEGGLADNIVPPLCNLILDRRFLPTENPDTIGRAIDSALDRVRERNPELVLECLETQRANAAFCAGEEDIVQTALRCHRRITGSRSGASGFLACCDMRFFSEAGIPAIILGPGSLNQAHKVNESVSISEVFEAAKVYASIAVDWLNR